MNKGYILPDDFFDKIRLLGIDVKSRLPNKKAEVFLIDQYLFHILVNIVNKITTLKRLKYEECGNYISKIKNFINIHCIKLYEEDPDISDKMTLVTTLPRSEQELIIGEFKIILGDIKEIIKLYIVPKYIN